MFFARTVESSSDRNRPDGIGVRETYSSENVLAAVREVKRLYEVGENVPAKRIKYATTRFPK